jgi:hypothetical protein
LRWAFQLQGEVQKIEKKIVFASVPQASNSVFGKTSSEGKQKASHQNVRSSHAKIETLGASSSFGGRRFAPAQALRFEELVVKLGLTPGVFTRLLRMACKRRVKFHVDFSR